MIGVAPISVVFQTTARLLELHPGELGTGETCPLGDDGITGTGVPTLPIKSSLMSNDIGAHLGFFLDSSESGLRLS